MIHGVNELTWTDIIHAAKACADRHKEIGHKAVYGVPTGGSVIAPYVASYLKVPVTPYLASATLIVDDLVDSGKTLTALLQMTPDQVPGFGQPMVDALFRKPSAPSQLASRAFKVEGWAHFPWEASACPEDAIVRMLQYLGEDVQRDGLKDTPKRVLKAMKEMTAGMFEDPKVILERQFDLEHDEMVVLNDIPFTSLCEHHMLPYSGKATVAYIPSEHRVVGLSKLARLVLCFARRLSIQERLTSQVVDALMEHLKPLGAACIIKAEHSCMACRGVKLPGTCFTSSALRGVLRTEATARAELMALIN